jgi:microcystin-dependent protein
MAEPYIGEIRMFPFGKVPNGWAPCNGQLLNVQQNAALFMLLGTAYGGDGKTTFGVPNLQGRVPVHPSTSVAIGAAGGEDSHALTVNELPQHTHSLGAGSATANLPGAAGNVWAASANRFAATPNTVMAPGALAVSGASAPHPNMQPYLVGNYCIAIVGTFPPRP